MIKGVRIFYEGMRRLHPFWQPEFDIKIRNLLFY